MSITKKQIFIGNVPTSTFDDVFTFKLDPRTEKINKFGLFSKRNDLVDQCGSFKLEIGGKEIFPSKTDTKEFTTSVMVAVKDKLFDLTPYEIDPGNLEIKVSYKHDPTYGLATFAPHDITFSFETILKV